MFWFYSIESFQLQDREYENSKNEIVLQETQIDLRYVELNRL